MGALQGRGVAGARETLLYDVASDPSDSKNLANENPDKLAMLTKLAKQAHEPVREGTYASTERHEHDRRAKFGKQDEQEMPKAKGKL